MSLRQSKHTSISIGEAAFVAIFGSNLIGLQVCESLDFHSEPGRRALFLAPYSIRRHYDGSIWLCRCASEWGVRMCGARLASLMSPRRRERRCGVGDQQLRLVLGLTPSSVRFARRGWENLLNRMCGRLKVKISKFFGARTIGSRFSGDSSVILYPLRLGIGAARRFVRSDQQSP